MADLWTEDGVYDVDTGILEGHEGIGAMVRGDAHQGLLAHGCGHVPGLPVVLLDGDRAVATGYTQLVVRSSRPGRYTVIRVTANRWELERRGPADVVSSASLPARRVGSGTAVGRQPGGPTVDPERH